MSGYDAEIGSRLVELRGAMSQRELALRMNHRGWKWTHVTVGSIEHGTRPIRLSEAVDAAIVLNTDLDSITGAKTPFVGEAALRQLRRAMDQVQAISLHAILESAEPASNLEVRVNSSEFVGQVAS